MTSTDTVIKYIVSAIILEDYRSAKLLCEKLYVEKIGMLALLYGIANVADNDQKVYKNILPRDEFKSELAKLIDQQFRADLDNLSQLELQKLFSSISKSKYMGLIENNASKSILRQMVNLKYLAMVVIEGTEIRDLLGHFDKFIQSLDNLTLNELEFLKITNPLFTNSPALDLELGRIFLKRADYNLAEYYFKKAFSSQPFSIEGYDLYSTVLWHLNRKDELFSLYLKFKNNYQDTVQYYIIKGNYYSFSGANERAISSFRKAQSDYGSNYALFLEGHDWLTLNNVDEAQNAFETLSKRLPDSFMPYFGLGITNFKKKKYERSLSFLLLAKQINPYNSNISCYCSIVLESLGKRSEALDVLNSISEPINLIVYFRKSKLFESMNMFKEAQDTLKQAIKLFPNDPALYFSLAEILHSQGQFSPAIKLLKRANELELNNSMTKDFINNIGV